MFEALEGVLRGLQRPAIAVSGGVDSVTLAALACDLLEDVALFHATSPAVPAEATARVRRLALQRGWQLSILDAGEFADPLYRANPANRCFHCKNNLYGAIRAHTERQMLSGANLDDLGEYRPGLRAAREHGVRHPYIEAGMHKAAVRKLARRLDLVDVAELPASPCLASRIETGIPIDSGALQFVHEVEQAVNARLRPAAVRCRIRAAAVVIELDALALERLADADRHALARLADARPEQLRGLPLQFAEYRTGSAFLIDHPS